MIELYNGVYLHHLVLPVTLLLTAVIGHVLGSILEEGDQSKWN